MPKQKQTNTTPSAPAAAPEAKPTIEREPNDFQLLYCNLAGDLIMNGGKRRDVEYLIRALDGHTTESMRDFMASARMHELYLLHNVLMSFESETGGPWSGGVESVLASAFMYEIEGNKTYVKVPRKYVDLVEQYVRLLNGENCQAG